MSEHNPAHLEILRHILGAQKHIAKSEWGFRNRYCAAIGGLEYAMLRSMEDSGLVVSGHLINRLRYFHATEAGCNAIGLTDKQRQNAMAP